MSKQDDFKIRSVPRASEKKPAQKDGNGEGTVNGNVKDGNASERPEKKSPRWIIYVGTTSAIFLMMVILLPRPLIQSTRLAAKPSTKSTKPKARGQQTDLASTGFNLNESIARHMQDADIQTAMMKRKMLMDNMEFKDALHETGAPDDGSLPEGRTYGVQMDSDQSAENVYEDLHDQPEMVADTLPADKINARLATRKWINETEHRERVQFITNFIRSAADRGYDVEIDQNLVVVGVKHINPTKKVNIDQVIDRLARQGL